MDVKETAICTKCGISKALALFSSKPDKINGRRSQCKDCSSSDYKKYSSTPRGRQVVKKYRSSDSRRKSLAKYIKNNTAKKNATIYLNNAVRDRRILRPSTCGRCGSKGIIQAHHWSYEKEHWLDVEWVCVECHAKIHKEIRNDSK